MYSWEGCQSQVIEAQREAVTGPRSHSQWVETELSKDTNVPEPQTFCSDVSSSYHQTLGFCFCHFFGSGTKEPGGTRPRSCQGWSQVPGGWEPKVHTHVNTGQH